MLRRLFNLPLEWLDYWSGRKTRRSFRFLRQRWVRGWDDSETWNLDVSFARLILPRLQRFKEVSIAYPMDLTPEQWDAVLDKMIYSFQHYANTWEESFDETPENLARVQEGLDLFAKWYPQLGW